MFEQEPLGEKEPQEEKTPQDVEIKSVANNSIDTEKIIDGNQEKTETPSIETLPQFQKRMSEVKEESLDGGSASLDEYDPSLADEIDQKTINNLEALQAGRMGREDFDEFFMSWRTSVEASKMDGEKDPVKQNQLILARYIANMATTWQLQQDLKEKKKISGK